MAMLNITEAAKLVAKDRSTLHRHISSGKLTCSRESGEPRIDTEELLRVYGKLEEHGNTATVAEAGAMQQHETLELLREQLRQAHEREAWLKKQLEDMQEHNRELARKMLPAAEEKKGFFAKLFGR